jgi:small-conductance mechanosensitive channel
VLEIVEGQATTSWAPILSVVLLVALPLVDMVLCRVLAALLAGRPGRVDGSVDARATFEPVLRRAIHFVVTVAGLLLLADLWHLSLFTLAERGLGARISDALLGIAITLLLARTLWELARTAIARRLVAERGSAAAERGEEGGDEPASRVRTLLPLFRGLLLAAIVVMATLSILSALGVNILPLLAGASVLGLAIGFGSQTLVRDVVSGAFYLVDDAFRLGEYVEVGDSKGTVEKIGIRSLHMRHHRGALNILPYGEIKRLCNTSRDWMIIVMQFHLTYDTDLTKVKKIVRRIGEELAADPELGPELLQPLKSQGVIATDESGLVVRVKFMAKPGSAPYLIRREAYTRILRAFAAEGIRFAGRQVTVVVPPDPATARASGTSSAVTAAAAAASDGGTTPRASA